LDKDKEKCGLASVWIRNIAAEKPKALNYIPQLIGEAGIVE
jgi:hypothetical protein